MSDPTNVSGSDVGGLPENRPGIDTRHDIDTRADCERLVRAFYGRALTDQIIGWLFTDVAKLDLEAHVPRITNFWETVLLDAHSYGGGAFRPHLELNMKVPLKHGHFERWLYLWNQTIDALFEGERAELAKAHAERVALAFESRLRSFEERGLEFAPGVRADDVELLDELPVIQHYRPT
jgi:hemoglobin